MLIDRFRVTYAWDMLIGTMEALKINSHSKRLRRTTQKASRPDRQKKAQLSSDDSEKCPLTWYAPLAGLEETHPWQLGYHNSHKSQKIDNEICQVVMGVVSTEKEKHNWDAQEELFSRGVLVAVVNLLPHVQIVVCPSIEFERYASDPVEHEIGTEHADDICECP